MTTTRIIGTTHAFAAEPAEARRRRGRAAGHAGRAAEDAALRRYVRDGARPRARNWRAGRCSGGGELDIVVEKDGAIVFVEVKARRTHDEAAAALRPAQQRRLSAAAEAFLEDQGLHGRDVRFDLALFDRAGRLEIIENALWA